MADGNFAGNIIVSLASLPDFLRKPILTKRMKEFFSLSDLEKKEIIENALSAGPTVDYARFEKLFKTWLEVLAAIPDERRIDIIKWYVVEIAQDPEKLIAFNMDAILGIFLTLSQGEQEVIAASVRNVISDLDGNSARVIKLVVPDGAQQRLGI